MHKQEFVVVSLKMLMEVSFIRVKSEEKLLRDVHKIKI